MKTISIILRNIKNLLPYLLLIVIYFFFINIEARNDRNNSKDITNKNKSQEEKSIIIDNDKIIIIPVIPYEKWIYILDNLELRDFNKSACNFSALIICILILTQCWQLQVIFRKKRIIIL